MEVEALREELRDALVALSRLASEVETASHKTNAEASETREQETMTYDLNVIVAPLERSGNKSLDNAAQDTIDNDLVNRTLREKDELEHELKTMRSLLQEEKLLSEEKSRNLEELQAISGRLQDEVLQMDKDKLRLNELVKQTREENEILGKVMEQITAEHEELKTRVKSDSSNAEKDAKIQALRNVSRALESENELLIQERENLERDILDSRKRQRVELDGMERRLSKVREESEDKSKEIEAKEAERKAFMERFERLQQEKMNVMRQLVETESELNIHKDDIRSLEMKNQELVKDREQSQEVLKTFNAEKNKVQSDMENILARNSSLNEDFHLSETRILSLEETIRIMEADKSNLASECNKLEQRLAESASLYEARIAEMQEELGLRLEEINANRDEELGKVKSRYIQLFDEKAEETHKVRDDLAAANRDLKEAKRRICDLEYREEELQNLLNRTQGSMEDKFKESTAKVMEETERLSKHTAEVETELETLKKSYDQLQCSYRSSVEVLRTRLAEITHILYLERRGELSEQVTDETSHETTEVTKEDTDAEELALRKNVISSKSEDNNNAAKNKRKKAKRKGQKSRA